LPQNRRLKNNSQVKRELLAVNLSFIGKKPTGLATYAINLIPELNLPGLDLFASSSFPAKDLPNCTYHDVPANMTSEQGKAGHLRRLWWTQFQLPIQLQKRDKQMRSPHSLQKSSLLFSPIPEAPLFTGCRFVVVMHDLIPIRFPSRTSPLTYYFRYYVPQVLKQAEHIICNSTATAQDVRSVYGIPTHKLTPIPLAHDIDHFRVLDPHDRNLSSTETPLVPTPPYFFYVGRHDPYKNLQRMITAFAALPKPLDCEFWIAGAADPRYTPTLQAQANELGVADRIKFLDYVSYNQLPVLLNQAIALVYPSLWEGFGFPVLEAMACGTPVITSNLSSLPEVAGDAALLVNPYSEAEITQAMQQILTDENTRSQLRSAGLARANQFSWTKTGAATAEILQSYL
jgi:glycosyltransferase involved in cell wall biosynthesis